MTRKPDDQHPETVEQLQRKVLEYERWFRTLEQKVRLLEHGRQRYAALVNQADAAFLAIDLEGNVRWANGIFRQRFAKADLDPTQLVGAPCHRVLCGKAKPCEECPARACSDEVAHRELRLWIGDQYRHVYATAMPITDGEGEVGQIFVMLQDLTELRVLRQSEQALRESEDRFRSLFEKVAVGMVRTKTDGTLLQVNPAFCTMLGYTESELLRKKYTELCHPDDLRTFEAQLQEALGHERSEIAQENRFRHRDGTWVWGHTTAVWQFDEENRPTYCTQLIQNIDQRKRALQALEDSRESHEALVNTIEGIVWEADPVTFEFSLVSKQAEKILGYPVERWLSQKRFWRNHVHPDDVERAVAECTESTREKRGHELEYRMIAADGRAVWLRDTVTVVIENDEVVKLRGVMFDITESKEAALALQRSETQLRQAQKMESIGRLAGGIAHDFNNLLTAITGYSDMLLKGLGANHPLRRQADGIARAARSAADLTGQLLAFSRQQVLQPKVLDLNESLRDMDPILHRLIGENIELVTTLAPSLGRIKADPGQIQQVVLNLAINARDALPDGGRVTIETCDVELDEAFTAGHAGLAPGGYVMLAIGDDGCGIDEYTRAHIFEPFFTTKSEKGTGLGLSTVYGIVTQSGGHVSVDSEPGRGSRFTVYLPRCDEAGPQPAREQSTGVHASPQPDGTETILLVEDDDAVRDLAREILSRNGYTIVEANNGSHALSVLEELERRIDLIVTDVVMPQMGGRDLADKAASALPGVKILFVSGYTLSAAGLESLPSPFFLPKPFTPDGLAQKVREVLDS